MKKYQVNFAVTYEVEAEDENDALGKATVDLQKDLAEQGVNILGSDVVVLI